MLAEGMVPVRGGEVGSELTARLQQRLAGRYTRVIYILFQVRLGDFEAM